MVRKMRGGDEKPVFEFDAIKMNVNNMDISFAHQLFIDGQFVDATGGRFLKSIDPATEKLICDVSIVLEVLLGKLMKFSCVLYCK